MLIGFRKIWHFTGVAITLTGLILSQSAPVSAAPIADRAAEFAPFDIQMERGGQVVAESHLASPARLPILADFVKSVEDGRAQTPVGIYVPGVLAFPIVQQPSGDPAYVSTQSSRVTQFRLASQYKTIGLLAHNNLAGQLFFNLQKFQILFVVYGDGSLDYYMVTGIQRFQALSPSSPYSDFVDLGNPYNKLSATDLFNRTYALGNRLIFQTCIEANGESSWGRLFITAIPIGLHLNAFRPGGSRTLVN
jgi:hypothetical protein